MARNRRGERLSLSEDTEKHPELAEPLELWAQPVTAMELEAGDAVCASDVAPGQQRRQPLAATALPGACAGRTRLQGRRE